MLLRVHMDRERWRRDSMRLEGEKIRSFNLRLRLRIRLSRPRFSRSSSTPACHREAIGEVDPAEFERLISLANEDGFQVEMTSATNDGGVDIVALNPQPIVRSRIAVQRYSGAVGSPAIDL